MTLQLQLEPGDVAFWSRVFAVELQRLAPWRDTPGHSDVAEINMSAKVADIAVLALRKRLPARHPYRDVPRPGE